MTLYSMPLHRKNFMELLVSLFSTSDRLDRYTGTPAQFVFDRGIPSHVHAFRNDGYVVEVTVYGDKYVDGVRIVVSNLDGSPSMLDTADTMYTPVTIGKVGWVSEVLTQLTALIGEPVDGPYTRIE